MNRAPRDLFVSVVSVVLLVMIGMRAIAQAIPTATGPGATILAGGGASLFYSPYGQRNLGGAHLFVDFQPDWRFGFETEVRYLRLHTSEEVSEKTTLLGPECSSSPVDTSLMRNF